MTSPIQLQRMPKRRRFKPATVRALFWVIAIPCFAIFCASCAGPDAIWWV